MSPEVQIELLIISGRGIKALQDASKQNRSIYSTFLKTILQSGCNFVVWRNSVHKVDINYDVIVNTDEDRHKAHD